MRYFVSSQYTGKSRRRKVFRILFLLVLAVALCAAALTLGNLLYDRVEKTAVLMQYAPYAYTPQDSAVSSLPLSDRRVPNDTVYGFYRSVDFSGGWTAEEWDSYCASVAESCDGLSFCATNGDEPLFAFSVFATDAADDTNVQRTDLEQIRCMAAAAKQNLLSVTAVADFPTDTRMAGELAAELYALGCSDVLFVPSETENLTEQDVQRYISAAESARALASEIRVGFSVSASFFGDVSTSILINRLAESVDFLALNATSATTDSLLTLCESVYGSISYYSLRILIAGNEESVTAQTEALRNAGYLSVLPVFSC